MHKTWLRTLAGISALAAGTLAMAQTAVIDFDPVAPPLIQPTHDEDGYRLSVSQGEVFVHDFFTPGNPAMQPTFGFASLSYLTVQAIDGGLFSGVSIDLLEATVFPVAFGLEAVGYRPDGSIASQYFTLDGLAGAETFFFNSDFAGLSRLELHESVSNTFSVEAVQIDNLTLTAAAVPEPGRAALWLLGLGGLGWALRRR